MPLRAKGVGGIGHDRYAAQRLLNLVVRRGEQRLLALDNLKDAVVIADHAAQVDRDDGFGAGSDGPL